MSRGQIRVRGIAVVPDEEATISVIGGDVQVDNAYVPEVDFTFFFTPNIAAELIHATTKHDAMAVGTTLGDVGRLRICVPAVVGEVRGRRPRPLSLHREAPGP